LKKMWFQKDIKLVPYKIIKADNGDAWVEVKGEKMAPPQNFCRSVEEDEENRRGLPGRAGD